MECNYNGGFITNIESSNYGQIFSLSTIWKFAIVLGVDVRDLFEPLDQDD